MIPEFIKYQSDPKKPVRKGYALAAELRERFGRCHFLAMDPGNYGAGLIYPPGAPADHPWAEYSLLGGQGVVDLANTVARRGVDLLVIEDQFLANSAMVTQKLSMGVGAFAGYVAALNPPDPVWVVLVLPSVWQAHQRKLTGQNAKKRAELAVMAADRAGYVFEGLDWYERHNKQDREGFDAALGIAEWWQHAMGGV